LLTGPTSGSLVWVAQSDTNDANAFIASPIQPGYYYEFTGTVPVTGIQEWVETTLP
jgi:hypothetical protein